MTAFRWPEKLRIIVARDSVVWGNNHDICRSWSDLLKAETKIKMQIAFESNAFERYRLLGHCKLFDLTTGSPNENRQMLMADDGYCVRDNGPFLVRSVWVAAKANSGFFVRSDSKFETPRDIEPGTRINRLNYAASTRVKEGLLAWARISLDDIIWVDINDPEENWQAVAEGKSDIGLSFPSSPKMYEAEEKSGALRWIDLNSQADPEGARRFREVEPLFHFGPISSGVPSAIGHWGMVNITFEQTHADTDSGFIYHLAKWFDENYDRFAERHPSNKFRNRETLLEGFRYTFLPCHEGLVAYLKDIGIWTKADDLRQLQNQNLVDRCVTTYEGCLKQADESKIRVTPENREWLDLWADYRKRRLPDLALI